MIAALLLVGCVVAPTGQVHAATGAREGYLKASSPLRYDVAGFIQRRGFSFRQEAEGRADPGRKEPIQERAAALLAHQGYHYSIITLANGAVPKTIEAELSYYPSGVEAHRRGRSTLGGGPQTTTPPLANG